MKNKNLNYTSLSWKEITQDWKPLNKTHQSEHNNTNTNMTLFMKNIKLLISKMKNLNCKMINSEENNVLKIKIKQNKQSQSFTWSNLPWKNKDHFSKWKKTSNNKKLTDIKTVATLFKLKIEKYAKLTLKFQLTSKILNQNSKKSANKLIFSNKQTIITQKRFKNCWSKTLRKTNL